MEIIRNAFYWLSLGLIIIKTSYPHQQCLNFAAPFVPGTPVSFCNNYNLWGCCQIEDDLQLKRTFLEIQEKLSTHDWHRCKDYLTELICQKCSPYAAHIYDSEVTRIERTFPGLCQEFCHVFFQDCSVVIPFVDPTLNGSSLLSDKETFCQHAALTDVDYCYPELLTSSALNGEAQQQKETKQGCLCLEPVAQLMASPLQARHAGDGTGRLFVVDQPGVVYILYPHNKTRLQTPFLNISSQVLMKDKAFDERGLLNIAFHPDFTNNGRFFLFSFHSLGPEELGLTREESELKFTYVLGKVRVSEMKVSDSDPNQADPSSQKTVIEIRQPYPNHNGGEMFFLDDGYLYLVLGDGGAGGDPFNLAQNKRTLFGKVLRLDVDSKPGVPYSIPADNPFLGEEQAGTRPEIFALGIRNIWRCGVDPGNRTTGAGRGRVVCGDVGQSAHEELNLLKAGANYGWNIKEGPDCFDPDNDVRCNKTIENEEPPIHSYPHSEGKSVIGGHFYRGCDIPALDGHFLYADYMNGRLFSLEETDSGNWTNRNLSICGSDVCTNGLTNSYDIYIQSFGLDEQGEVYILTVPRGFGNRLPKAGKVYKLVDPYRTRNSTQENCTQWRYPVPRGEQTTDLLTTGEQTTDDTSTANCFIAHVTSICFAIMITFIV